MTTMLSNTFHASLLCPLISELIRQGVDPGDIERWLGRRIEETKAPFQKWPLFILRRFWTELSKRVPDGRHLGFEAGKQFVETFRGTLVYLFDATPSLVSALSYIQHYSDYFSGHFRLEWVSNDPDSVDLLLVESGTLKASSAHAWYILSIHYHMIRRKLTASGCAETAIRSILMTDRQAARARLDDWPVPVSSGQPCAGIQLDRAHFEKELIPVSAELEVTLSKMFQQMLVHSVPTLLNEVADFIVERLENAPTLSDFCLQRHVTERTAKRKLKTLGWRFSEILDAYRQHRAEDLLAENRLEVSRISDRLGYSDTQSFTRACQRWVNMPPSVWRESLIR